MLRQWTPAGTYYFVSSDIHVSAGLCEGRGTICYNWLDCGECPAGTRCTKVHPRVGSRPRLYLPGPDDIVRPTLILGDYVLGGAQLPCSPPRPPSASPGMPSLVWSEGSSPSWRSAAPRSISGGSRHQSRSSGSSSRVETTLAVDTTGCSTPQPQTPFRPSPQRSAHSNQDAAWDVIPHRHVAASVAWEAVASPQVLSPPPRTPSAALFSRPHHD
eukprot:TRINITY_DN18948_c0_g1_i2.p1 TRINITY_DN18948_c0_g1~~TRINITY_DN18948_c0_g1_i2.p1  ORF type:complete len:215 (+),score=33.14 TRINITY_DN18948_c0_g1_i2:385-1029(+)